MIGMFGGMATAMIPEEPETHKVKQIVQSALTIVLKLGPTVSLYLTATGLEDKYSVAALLKAVESKDPEELEEELGL